LKSSRFFNCSKRLFSHSLSNISSVGTDRCLKFLLPMQSMTEDTIVRRKMVKNKEHLICLSVELLLLCHNKTILNVIIQVTFFFTVYFSGAL
jgi:hypothetical protein